MTDFDNVVKNIGEFGAFQKKIFYGVQVTSFSLNLQMLVLVFAAAQPKWSCLEDFSSAPCTKTGAICPKARFSSDFTSIATEWNLVCGQAYKNELVQSVFMAGTMLGAPLLGKMTDLHGRKKMWMISVTGGLLLSFLSAFATTYNMFVVLRFVAGLFVGGERLVMYVLSTETVGPSYRGTTGTLSQGCFAVSIAVLGALAYYIRHWRILVLATCIPSLPCLLLFKYIPESPRWLVAKGRIKEAEKILLDGAKENQRGSVPLILDCKGPEEASGKTATVHEYGFLDLFIIPSLRIITVITMTAWFVNGMVYYGLSLNVKNLGGNVYLTFIFAALVEIPSYSITVVLMEYFGRRKSFFGFMIAASAACFTCMKLQHYPESTMLIASAAMLGKFCISASYAIVYVYAAELFPTVVRSIGLGLTSVSSRLGGILSPLIVAFAEYDKTLPMMVFALVALIAGLLGLKLPETKGKSLPDTVEENRSIKSQKGANGEKLD